MYLRFFLFAATILAALSDANPDQDIKPYDLEDQVREILETLRSEIRGQIFAAFNSIDTVVRDVFTYRTEQIDAAKISIGQEFETVSAQITTLKDLAQTAGQDVEICLAANEPLLNQLPQDIIDTLMECLAFANREITIIQNDSRYRIDTLMNEVHIFDFQLDLCAGEFLCLSPLIEQIELALISIPQKIGVIVLEAGDLGEDLKVLIKECTDSRVAQFVTESSIIVADVTECVNNILS